MKRKITAHSSPEKRAWPSPVGHQRRVQRSLILFISTQVRLTLIAALSARVAVAAIKWSQNEQSGVHWGALEPGTLTGWSRWEFWLLCEEVRGYRCSKSGAVLLKGAQNPPCFISVQTEERPGQRRPNGSISVCLLRKEEDYTWQSCWALPSLSCLVMGRNLFNCRKLEAEAFGDLWLTQTRAWLPPPVVTHLRLCWRRHKLHIWAGLRSIPPAAKADFHPFPLIVLLSSAKSLFSARTRSPVW